MIDKDMVNEVLRWMLDRDQEYDEDDPTEQMYAQFREAGIEPETMAYFAEKVPEDIMREAAKQRQPGENPVLLVQIALYTTWNTAFEAGVRCAKINMERGGD